MSKVSSGTTEFGFNFGSMEVTRTCSYVNGVAVISVKTPKSRFSIRATKNGSVRFYDNHGNECEFVNKAYVSELELNKSEHKALVIDTNKADE